MQAYIKEQKWLDAVFDKYDTNKSGQLEKGQLIELLRRVSPGVGQRSRAAAHAPALCCAVVWLTCDCGLLRSTLPVAYSSAAYFIFSGESRPGSR